MAIYRADALPFTILLVIAAVMCRLQALQAQSTVFDPASIPVKAAGSTKSDRPWGNRPKRAYQAFQNPSNQQGESQGASIAGVLSEQPASESHQAEQLEHSKSGALLNSTHADATEDKGYQHEEQRQDDALADVKQGQADLEQEGATAMVDGHGVDPETSSSSSEAASSKDRTNPWAGPDPAIVDSTAEQLHLNAVDSNAHQQASATDAQSDSSTADSIEATLDGSQANASSADAAAADGDAAAAPVVPGAAASSTSSTPAADIVAVTQSSAGSAQGTAATDMEQAAADVTDVAEATGEADQAVSNQQQQQGGDLKSLTDVHPAAEQSGVLTSAEQAAEDSNHEEHASYAQTGIDTSIELPEHAAAALQQAVITSNQQEQQQTEQVQTLLSQAPKSDGEEQANTEAGDTDVPDHNQWLASLTESNNQDYSKNISGVAAAQQHPEGVKQDSELEGQQEGTATVVQQPVELQVGSLVEGREEVGEQQPAQQTREEQSREELPHVEHDGQQQLEAQLQELEAAEGAQMQQDDDNQADQVQQQQQQEDEQDQQPVGDLVATGDRPDPQQSQQGGASETLQDPPLGLADAAQGQAADADHSPADVGRAADTDAAAAEAAETEGHLNEPANGQQEAADQASAEATLAHADATSGGGNSQEPAADGPNAEAQLLAGGPNADSQEDAAAAVAASGAAHSQDAAQTGDANAETVQLVVGGSVVHAMPRHKSILHTLLVAALMMMLAGVVMLVVYGNSNSHAAVGSQKASSDSWSSNSGLGHLAAGLWRSRMGPVLPVSSSFNTPLLVLDYCTSTEGAQRVGIKRESSTSSFPECNQGLGSSRDGEAAAGQRGSYVRAARNGSKHDF